MDVLSGAWSNEAANAASWGCAPTFPTSLTCQAGDRADVAAGHMINHPPGGTQPNVVLAPFDWRPAGRLRATCLCWAAGFSYFEVFMLEWFGMAND